MSTCRSAFVPMAAVVFVVVILWSSSSLLAQLADAQNCSLPCLPCLNSGTCDASTLYTHTDGQIFGTCACPGNFSGPQCENDANEVCAQFCNHQSKCSGGACQCVPEFTGPSCKQPVCFHQAGGVGDDKIALPYSNGTCAPCQDGFGEVFCRAPMSQANCPVGTHYSTSHWSSAQEQLMTCTSDDYGWYLLLEGITDLVVTCSKPLSRWNDTGATDGTCRFEFHRFSNTNLREELFYCIFDECAKTAYMQGEAMSTSTFTLADEEKMYTEPTDAAALRYLMFVFAILSGIVPLLNIPRKHIVVMSTMSALMLFVVLNIAVASKINEDENAQSGSGNNTIVANETQVALDCQKSQCFCNYDATATPNCAVSQFDNLVNGLTKKMKFLCSNTTGNCIFTHEDLFDWSFDIKLQCRPHDCVSDYPTNDIPRIDSEPAGRSATSIVVGSAVAFVAFVLVVSMGVEQYLVRQSAARWRDLVGTDENEAGAVVSDVAPAKEAEPSARVVAVGSLNGSAAAGAGVVAGSAIHVGVPSTTGHQEQGSSAPQQAISLRAKGVSYFIPPTRFQQLVNAATSKSSSGQTPTTATPFSASPLATTQSFDDGRVIVNDLNLTFRSGTIVAIMGPSGCGKTSFLDILCRRDKPGDVEENIAIAVGTRGKYVRVTGSNEESFRRIVSYVADDDVILPSLTVHSALMYAAELRQPVFIPYVAKKTYVDVMIKTFRLEQCRETTIGAMSSIGGDERGGLSQGERRRVAIALHLISLPRVLVVDEPTTGLDSYNARVVLQCLYAATRAFSPFSSPTGTCSSSADAEAKKEKVAQVEQEEERRRREPKPGSDWQSSGGDDDDEASQQESTKMKKKTMGVGGGTDGAYHSPLMEGLDDVGEFLGGYYRRFYNYAPMVLLTIHQPSSDMMLMFDRVVLMARGCAIYHGSPDVDAASAWADRYGFAGALATTTLPDALLEVASTVSAETAREMADEVKDQFVLGHEHDDDDDSAGQLASEEEESNGADVEGDDQKKRRVEGTERKKGCADVFAVVDGQRQFYTRTWQQIAILLRRGFGHMVGSGRAISLHFVISSTMTLLVSFLYTGSDKDVPGTLNKAGAVTFYLLWISIVNLSALDLFIAERPTYVFETLSTAYHSVSYFAAKIILDFVLLRVIPTAIGGSMMYFQIGLRAEVDRFGYFLLITILFGLCTSGLSSSIACVVPSFGTGLLVNGFVIVLFFAFGGFISQSEVIPTGIAWMKYISPFYYAFESLMVNELGGRMCFFAPRDAEGETTTISIPLACEQYLFNLGLKPKNFSFDVSMLGIWTAVYIVSSFAFLALFVRGKR